MSAPDHAIVTRCHGAAVTFRDKYVKQHQRTRPNLQRMKNTTLILNLALLAALPVAASDSTLRYDLSGDMQLTMEQEIFAGGRKEAIAGRNFSMTFGFDKADGDELLVELKEIRGSYTAHGMSQRLPASHLAGSEFRLLGNGLSCKTVEPGPEVNVGQITDGNLRPSEILASLLPVLPDGPVSVGMTWESERSIRSLEGWAFAGGKLKRHHEASRIDQLNGRTIVSVKTRGKAIITAAAGTEGFIGDGTLEQTIDWKFDASNGQLLSLIVVQEASGTNQLPQGEVAVRQVTRYELLSGQ